MRRPFAGLINALILSTALWLIIANGVLAAPKVEAHLRAWHHRLMQSSNA